MLLIADSGSTKCDWISQNDRGETLRFSTIGFNPLFHSSDWIENEIRQNAALMNIAEAVTRLAYYGASVSSPERQKTVTDALNRVFKNAVTSTNHDLTGSVYATCGKDAGIACILGTGSNSCYFDGVNIIEKVPALGYILGDEAGGAWFGKELLKMYLYHELPENMNKTLKEAGAEKEVIFDKVYKQPGANRYLAGFSKIMQQYRELPVIQNLLQKGFDEFLNKHVCIYEEHTAVKVHFVGSIAVHFRKELEQCCAKKGITTGVFTNEPAVSLYQYHCNYENL